MKRFLPCFVLSLTVASIFSTAARAQSTDASQPKSAVAVPTVFYAASIKPSSSTEKSESINSWRWEGGRFTATNISVEHLIDGAYGGLWSGQVEGLPNWAKSQGYTIEAVMPPDMPQLAPQEMAQTRRQMLQTLLADRFALKVHKTTQQLSVFEIVVAKGGPKLTPYDANEQGVNGVTGMPSGHKFVGVTVQFLAYYLSMYAGRIVIDKTGLTGRYDFTLASVSPNPAVTNSGADSGSPAQAAPADESVLSEMKEQLGLELKDAKDPVTVFVVDHVEEPTPN